jgi:hypothetical protein
LSISTARSSPATAAATAAAISEGRKSRQCVPAPQQEQCQLGSERSWSQLCMKIPCLLTSGYAQNQLCRSQGGAPARRVAAVEPVEEVVDVREGSDRLHPPVARAEEQELHPLDRLRLEHVPCVPDLQVEGRGNVGLLHLGSQGQACHGQQLRHPSFVFLKWRGTRMITIYWQ